MALQWVSVDARTGIILADFPDLDVQNVAQTLTRYEVTTGNLPIPTAPDGWQRATMTGAANLILLDDNPNDPSHGIPIWGGMVTKRTPNQSDLLPLTLATLEAYFDRRFVGDVVYAGVGQNAIVADLIARFVADGVKPGLPIRVQYTNAGTLRDRTYNDIDDKTVYSVLTELAGVIGGPEWTVGWEWRTNPERITPVLYVGDRIGVSPSAGLSPNATFEIPGPVIAIALEEDFSSGRGATDVMAVSTAQGSTRPQSAHMLSGDTVRPTFEFRFTPSTSITSVSVLTGHAQASLVALQNGTRSTMMSAVAANAPRLGVDFFIGDDVGYVAGGLDANGKYLVPAFAGGLIGVARAIGWDLAISDTPILTPVLTAPTSF